MTSETSNLHVSKDLNISKTKQDIEKLKTRSGSSVYVVLMRFKLDPRFFVAGHFKDFSLKLMCSVWSNTIAMVLELNRYVEILRRNAMVRLYTETV